MKPKIVTRLANVFAKLASSPEYDPNVKYKTPLEYYANEIPVLPKPNVSNIGDALFVGADGYELKAIPSGPQLPVPTEEDAGKVPTVQKDGTYALANVDGGSNILPVYFWSEYVPPSSTVYHANVTKQELDGARENGIVICGFDYMGACIATYNSTNDYYAFSFIYLDIGGSTTQPAIGSNINYSVYRVLTDGSIVHNIATKSIGT